ncbi:tumor necrosis factor receptor superfamily member 5-like isoform X2 [Xyrauchen texanus]|uniref:tumor necrosis factor receptor superfamily member 5-like isoform X2 n=1 Tax=Xyrauchen texanus TaxID=154827 RepID=UPI0022426295|nr:tumor necrosis factor receptor superfamily member 5-like isoform X2 [Xyrauchen texanus]
MSTVFTLCLVAMMFCLVLSCEEQTHYMKENKCCKMCGPGKRMLVDDNCEDPRCQDCLDGEYQSTYTHDTKCERQPSCDTNLHFLPQSNPSKTELSKCQCKHGYYCSAEDECSTCKKHTVCKPGQRILKNGTSISDTACAACIDGTFSSHDSASTCFEWTKCKAGYVQGTSGNLTSDRTCVQHTPSDRVTILLFVGGVLLLIIAAIVLMIYIRKRKIGWNRIPKNPIVGIGIIQNGDIQALCERGDQTIIQQPQEDIDNTEPVSPSSSNVTENGNVVEQEDGKHSIIASSETGSTFF